jgi:hypothetical protein
MDGSKLIQIVNDYNIGVIDVTFNVRKRYSGRGMYGADCIGIVMDRVTDGYLLIHAMVIDEADQEDILMVADFFANAKTDSMGLQMIVYNTSYVYEGEDND